MEKRDLRSLYRAQLAVAVGGPPHSGKSVFLAELYQQLLAKAPKSNFVFLQRMCPDGEGVWSAESRPEVVKKIRRKGKFAPGFLERHLPLWIGPALVGSFHILLADLGGVRSAENAEILWHCTDQIILSSKDEDIELWSNFAGAEKCNTLARFRSELVKVPGSDELDLTARSEVKISGDSITGTFRNLDRGKETDTAEIKLLRRECYRQAVSQFADWLITKNT